jgi:hypothetical protein
MMHVDVKGVLCHSELGMRAGREVRVRWAIQTGKDRRRMREVRRRAMVVGVRIVVRSALRMARMYARSRSNRFLFLPFRAWPLA